MADDSKITEYTPSPIKLPPMDTKVAPPVVIPAAQPVVEESVFVTPLMEKLSATYAGFDHHLKNTQEMMHYGVGSQDDPAILAAQDLLINLNLLDNRAKRGAENRPDGAYGNKTAEAVRQFQTLFDRPLVIGDMVIPTWADGKLGRVTMHAMKAYAQANGDMEKAYPALEKAISQDRVLLDFFAKNPRANERETPMEQRAIDLVLNEFGGKKPQGILEQYPFKLDPGVKTVVNDVTIGRSEGKSLEMPNLRDPRLASTKNVVQAKDGLVTWCGITFHDASWFEGKGIKLTPLEMDNVIISLHNQMKPDDFQKFATEVIATRHHGSRAYDVFHPALQYNMMDLDLLKTDATRWAMLNALVRVNEPSAQKPFVIDGMEFTSGKGFTPTPTFQNPSAKQMEYCRGQEFSPAMVHAINEQFATPEKGAEFIRQFNLARIEYHRQDAARGWVDGIDRSKFLNGWKRRALTLMPPGEEANQLTDESWKPAQSQVQGFYAESLKNPAPQPSALRLTEVAHAWAPALPFESVDLADYQNVVIKVMPGDRPGQYQSAVFYNDDVVANAPKLSKMQKDMQAQPEGSKAVYIPLVVGGRVQPVEDVRLQGLLIKGVAAQVGEIRHEMLSDLVTMAKPFDRSLPLLGMDISHYTLGSEGASTPEGVNEAVYASFKVLVSAHMAREAGIIPYALQEAPEVQDYVQQGIDRGKRPSKYSYTMETRMDAAKAMPEVVADEYNRMLTMHMLRDVNLATLTAAKKEEMLMAIDERALSFTPMVVSEHFDGHNNMAVNGWFVQPSPGEKGLLLGESLRNWSGFNGAILGFNNRDDMDNGILHNAPRGMQKYGGEIPVALVEAANGNNPNSAPLVDAGWIIKQSMAQTTGLAEYAFAEGAVLSLSKPMVLAAELRGIQVPPDQLLAYNGVPKELEYVVRKAPAATAPAMAQSEPAPVPAAAEPKPAQSDPQPAVAAAESAPEPAAPAPALSTAPLLADVLSGTTSLFQSPLTPEQLSVSGLTLDGGLNFSGPAPLLPPEPMFHNPVTPEILALNGLNAQGGLDFNSPPFPTMAGLDSLQVGPVEPLTIPAEIKSVEPEPAPVVAAAETAPVPSAPAETQPPIIEPTTAPAAGDGKELVFFGPAVEPPAILAPLPEGSLFQSSLTPELFAINGLNAEGGLNFSGPPLTEFEKPKPPQSEVSDPSQLLQSSLLVGSPPENKPDPAKLLAGSVIETPSLLDKLSNQFYTINAVLDGKGKKKVFELGDRDDPVISGAQEFLIAANLLDNRPKNDPDAPNRPDGDYGRKTHNAVVEFQKKFPHPVVVDGVAHELVPDGKLGRITAHAMKAYAMANGNMELAQSMLQNSMAQDPVYAAAGRQERSAEDVGRSLLASSVKDTSSELVTQPGISSQDALKALARMKQAKGSALGA